MGLKVQTFASAQEFLTSPRPNGPTCLVLDVQLPGLSGLDLQQELAKVGVQIPIIFITGHGDIPMTVRAMKAGAIEFLTKPFHDEDLLNAVEQAIHRGRQIEQLTHTPATVTPDAEHELRSKTSFSEIVGQSVALREVFKKVEIVAPTDSTVLIYGETGTGKELIARAIHHLSRRSSAPFVKINCAAIPTGLLESELFGHEKGAFTSAIAQRVGRFELADGGTLFLDEIGDLPLELQAKLLRVLQDQEFERLGSAKTVRVDVRLVTATNCNLVEMVKAKQFRSDLYYRLNVFPLPMPSLRERREDIPLLVSHFVQKFATRMGKYIESIPDDTLAALLEYDWPGNVRELQNLIERAVILSRGTALSIPLSELQLDQAPTNPSLVTLEEAERQHILQALQRSRWVVGGPKGAAVKLGLKRTGLQSKMQQLGISRPQ